MDKNKYEYSGHGNGFDARSSLLLSNRNEFGKNVISFGVNNSLLVHADNKEHFFFGKGPIDILDCTAITAEAEYSINFSEKKRYLVQVCMTMGATVFCMLML